MVTLLRINEAHDDSLRHWLIGHPAKDTRVATPTGSERRSVTRLQNVITGAGWREKKFEDGSNAHVEFEGSGTLQFGSALEAWRFKNSLSHPSAAKRPHPWAGDVVLRMPTGEDTFEEVMIPDALVSLAPIMGGGESLNLTYTARGPHVEPLRTGERRLMGVDHPTPALMDLYGVAGASGFTSGTQVQAWSLVGSQLPVGGFVNIYGTENSVSSIGKDQDDFALTICTPSDSRAGTEDDGVFYVPFPLEDNLSMVTTYINGLAKFDARLVTGPAPHVQVEWAGAAGDGLDLTRLTCIVTTSSVQRYLARINGDPDAVFVFGVNGMPFVFEVNT